jgi:hypothetical protein
MTAAVHRLTAAISLDGLTPAELTGAPPRFEWVDPKTLQVAEAYQRALSERSVTLIRKIISRWDWTKFKPPVVAETDAGLEVIDGQHTAIAAASHPGIASIPVMVVHAPELKNRASAFVGHNKDRLNLTPTQIHIAAVQAQDEDALVVEQVCRDAGVNVLKAQPGKGLFKPGDTMAVQVISRLVIDRGTARATEILVALRGAEMAPISAAAIKAADMLLSDPEYAGQVGVEVITLTLRRLGDRAEQEARVFAATHRVPIWKALGITIFRNRRRAAA